MLKANPGSVIFGITRTSCTQTGQTCAVGNAVAPWVGAAAVDKLPVWIFLSFGLSIMD